MLFRPITLPEANALLPFIEEIFVEIHTLANEGQFLHELSKMSKEETQISASFHGNMSENEQEVLANNQKRNKKIEKIEEEIRQKILYLSQFGVIVRNIYPPQVEFFSKRNDQPIYLSWQKSENKVCHWYPIDCNFYSRRPIEDPKPFGNYFVH